MTKRKTKEGHSDLINPRCVHMRLVTKNVRMVMAAKNLIIGLKSFIIQINTKLNFAHPILMAPGSVNTGNIVLSHTLKLKFLSS